MRRWGNSCKNSPAVFKCPLKTCNDGDDVTCTGSPFQIGAAETGKARSPTVQRRVVWMTSAYDDEAAHNPTRFQYHLHVWHRLVVRRVRCQSGWKRLTTQRLTCSVALMTLPVSFRAAGWRYSGWVLSWHGQGPLMTTWSQNRRPPAATANNSKVNNNK